MKRRLVVWVTFLAGLYYVLQFVLPPTFGGAIDNAGATAPTLLPGPGGEQLCYTGLAADRAPRLLLAKGGSSAPTVLIAPSFARRDDYEGAENPQFVAANGVDLLYYIGLGYDDKIPRVCLARRNGDRWVPERYAVLDSGPPGAWDASGIRWGSVLPPDSQTPLWRMWYIGMQGNVGRVGLAISTDGTHWAKTGKPLLEGGDRVSLESVSVLPFAGGLRAWIVRTDSDHPEGRLFTVPLAAVTGAPIGALEPVAWQRASDSSKGLVDVRAVAVPNDPQRVRLYVTTPAPDGRPQIGVAESLVGANTGPALRFRPPLPVVTPGPLPHSTYLSEAGPTVDNLVVIVGAFAVGLGLISLIQVHGKRVMQRRRGWPESIAFFAAVTSMALTTLYTRLHPVAAASRIDTFLRHTYEVLFTGLYQSLGAAMFSLLAAYLVSASYRAFKVRTLESSLMTAAAALVMLGQVPIGNLLTHRLPASIQIPTVMAWVLYVANNAVVRAVNFGIFVGTIATALRIWLSMDQASLGQIE